MEDVNVVAAVQQIQPHLRGAISPPKQKRRSSSEEFDDPLGPNGKSLNPTKRAQQNRNAQRSFRMRKEQRIKELEVKAEQFKYLEATIEALKNENLQLRDYCLALQSRLLETDSGVGIPTPPVSIFTNGSSMHGGGHGGGTQQAADVTAANNLINSVLGNNSGSDYMFKKDKK